MAALQIEGETESLTEKQIQFVRDVLEKRGFTNNKVTFEAAGKAGDNFVADVKRISVAIEGEKDFKMIAKFAPKHEALRKMMNTKIVFSNEILMYEEVLPKLVSLQMEAGVPETDLFKFAHCYGTFSEEPHEVILLEDLKELNFVMLDRLSSLDNDAVRLVMKNFAILHSLSYALKQLEPETYNKFASDLNDVWAITKNSPDYVTFINKVEEDAIDIVEGDYYKSVLQNTVSQIPMLLDEVKNADKKSKDLVIQQGDGWTNNILFKLKGNGPSECILIDYQLSNESKPVCDILYMIFNCTDHITRSKYYKDWIDYYHEQLNESLSHFGMTANTIFPREKLDIDLKRYAKAFFGTAVMLTGILCRKPEEAKIIHDAMKNLDRETLDKNIGSKSASDDTFQLFKSRVQGLIDTCRDFGYIG